MRANSTSGFKIQILLNKPKNIISVVSGPSGLERRTVCDFAREVCWRPVSVSLRGSSGPGGRTVHISWIEFGQGQCVFVSLHYGPFEVFSRTISGPCAADGPLEFFWLTSALLFQVDRSRTVRPRTADHPALTFLIALTCFKRSI
jgi:hypothetical protein